MRPGLSFAASPRRKSPSRVGPKTSCSSVDAISPPGGRDATLRLVGALLVAVLLTQGTPPPLVNADSPTTPLPPPPATVSAGPVDAGVPELSTPPIFTSDLPVDVPVATPPPKDEPTEPERTAVLHFAPLSLFATHLSFELEKAVSKTVTVFGVLGASLVPQVGFDLGLRIYVGDHLLEGPFLAVQGSAFWFSPATTLLIGPGAMFGYVFRPKSALVLSIGAGLQVWTQVTPDSSIRVLGVQPQTSVILLPGFQRPGVGSWAPQPMLRFTVGPAF